MFHYWSLEGVQLQGAWLTIGSFDGVHRGHQEIVCQLTAGAHAAGAPAVVLTFYPHPAEVLKKRQGPLYLTSPEERAELLKALGVDVVISHPFNLQVAGLSAREFIERLHQHLDMNSLFVGHDFALGHGREGNVEVLKGLGETFGYTVAEMSPVTNGGEVISSSLIRAALTEGQVDRAAWFLGRPYQVSGEVVRGDARGRALGIPTANLAVWTGRVIPKSGVYVCQAEISGEMYGAVANIGVRPTFEAEPVPARVEAHLLDFDRDIYGLPLRLKFLARLRDEQRFPNLQALVDQIHRDIEQARDHLAAL